MDAAHVLALWLHSLAMVIVVGYYGILGRIVLPALRGEMDGPALGRALPAVERKALPIVLIAIVLFIATGSYLLAIDDRYQGLGNFFATTWSTLMLVKHGLVVAMIGLGVGVDRLARAAGEADDATRGRAVDMLGLAAEGTMVLGVLVLLLTAIAQAS